MLNDSEQSVLLVIDVQGKLLPAIREQETVLGNTLWLVRAAKRIGVPAVATEQYPKGLGATHPDLLRGIPQESIGEKMHFSCCQSGRLTSLPGSENQRKPAARFPRRELRSPLGFRIQRLCPDVHR